MIKRILALVVAVAMVGGAFAYRSSRDGGDAGGGGDSTDEVAGGIYCAAELGPVCDAIPGAKVQATTETFERLVTARSAADAGVRVWVTAGPWADIVDEARTGRPQLFSKSRPLASTPLVSVLRKGTLPSGCGATASWKCLGDLAQEASAGLGGDPPTDVGHLFIRAAALGGFLDKTNYAINDLDESSAAESWILNVDSSLDRGKSFQAGSLSDYLATRGVGARVFFTTEVAVKAVGPLPDFDVFTPTPAAIIGAFVAVADGGRADVDEDRIREALTKAGWKAAAPPAEDGLPSPGVLVALRGRLG